MSTASAPTSGPPESPKVASHRIAAAANRGARGIVEADLVEFHNPRLEWRRLISEFVGTFFLVLVAAGAGVVAAWSGGEVGLGMAVVAPALMVLAIILFMGAVSGAHLNPAVSVAFAIRGDFPWRRVPGYVAVQALGAVAAAGLLRAYFGIVGELGQTLPGPGVGFGGIVLWEAVLTFGLVSTILGTASGAQSVGAFAAIGVGSYIALAGLWAAPVTGASMNPARSFGPALAAGDLSGFWPYLVGPLCGSVLAAGFSFVLRGRGGDLSARLAASGRLVGLEGKDPEYGTPAE